MDEVNKIIEELKAKDDIRELTAKYCWFVTRSNGAAVAELFTEDGEIEIGPQGTPPVVRGRVAISKLVDQTPRASLIPLIHNHIIEINGDTANGTAVVESRVTPGPDVAGMVGFYHDDYRKVAGRWLFAKRKYGFYFLQGKVNTSFE